MSEQGSRKFAKLKYFLKLSRNSLIVVWITLKTHLGLFMPEQYYQVAMNDS